MPEVMQAFLPMQLDVAIESDAVFAAWNSTGMMVTLGIRGIQRDSGEPVVFFACDVPEAVRAPMDKPEQELRDVEEALTYLLTEPESPELISVVPGPHPNDPPDVIANLSDGSLACEAFQLHMPATGHKGNVSPGREARFDRLRSQLIAQAAQVRTTVQAHVGSVVYVWFGDPGAPADVRQPDRDAANLIDLLQANSPPSGPPPTDPWPTTAPPDHVQWNTDKTLGLTWSSLPPPYVSDFRSAFGFELALVHGVTIRRSDITAELRRLVEQHDRPVTDLLIVSVNVSYRSGLYFPSSKALADLLFDGPDPLGGWIPTNLTRIVVHDPADPGRVRWLLGQSIRSKTEC